MDRVAHDPYAPPVGAQQPRPYVRTSFGPPFPVERLVRLGASSHTVRRARQHWRTMTYQERRAEIARLASLSDTELQNTIHDEMRPTVGLSDVPANAGEVVAWVGRSQERARLAQDVEQSRERPRASVLRHTQRVLD